MSAPHAPSLQDIDGLQTYSTEAEEAAYRVSQQEGSPEDLKAFAETVIRNGEQLGAEFIKRWGRSESKRTG